MKDIILCDIDGTVANNDHRQHFLQGNKDWDGFFSDLSNDAPIYPVINLVNEESKKGKKIMFLTGRPERYRYSTTSWLKDYFSFEIILYMRPDNDKSNKTLVKRNLFEKNFNKEDIFCVIDNDPVLLDMWKNMKLQTIDANELYD